MKGSTILHLFVLHAPASKDKFLSNNSFRWSTFLTGIFFQDSNFKLVRKILLSTLFCPRQNFALNIEHITDPLR